MRSLEKKLVQKGVTEEVKHLHYRQPEEQRLDSAIRDDQVKDDDIRAIPRWKVEVSVLSTAMKCFWVR